MKICVLGIGVIGSILLYELNKLGFNVIGISLRKKIPHIGLIQSILQKFPEDVEMAYRSRMYYKELEKELGISLIKDVHSITIIHRDKYENLKNVVQNWLRYNVNTTELSYRDIKFMNTNENEIYLYSTNGDVLIYIHKFVNFIWRNYKILQRKILGVKEIGNKYRIVCDKGYVDCDCVIFTLGAWNRKFLSNFVDNPPLISYKCQAGLFIINNTLPNNLIIYDYVNKIYVRPCLEKIVSILNRILRLSNKCITISGNGNTPPIDPDSYSRKIESWFVNEMIIKLSKRFNKVHYLLGKADFCEISPDLKPIFGKIVNNVYVIGGFNGYGVEIGPGIVKSFIKYFQNQKLDEIERKYLLTKNRFKKIQFNTSVEAHEL